MWSSSLLTDKYYFDPFLNFQVYLLRKMATNRIGTKNRRFYICSLSCDTVVYKVFTMFIELDNILLNEIFRIIRRWHGGVVRVLDLLTSVPGCHSLDLFLVTLSSTPHLHCVAAKLDCLLWVGIFKHLMFISVIVKCYWIVMEVTLFK